jgi:hypothetical protein
VKLTVLAIIALMAFPLVPTSATPATPGNLTLIGHSTLGDRGDNAALAIDGNCAYVGYRGYNLVSAKSQRGVGIVDISDPTNPVLLGNLSGTIIMGSTPRELRADPITHRLYVMFYSSSQPYTPVTAFENGFLVYDITDCQHPVQIGQYDMGQIKPHEFYLWEDPARPGRTILYVSEPFYAPTLRVLDFTDASNPKLVTVFDEGVPAVSLNEAQNSYLGNYVHSMTVSPDGRTLHLAYWDAGYMIADSSMIADDLPAAVIRPVTPAPLALSYAMDNGPLGEGGNTHSAMQIPGQPNYALLVDEAYNGIGGCPYGWMHIVDISNPIDLRGKEVATFKMPENDASFCANTAHDGTWTSHNPTITHSLALTPWHADGLVVVDISNPLQPSMAAQYLPDVTNASLVPAKVTNQAELQAELGSYPVLFWSYPIVKDGLVYVVDIRNGLFVFKYDGPHQDELDNTVFLEGNSNIGDLVH